MMIENADLDINKLLTLKIKLISTITIHMYSTIVYIIPAYQNPNIAPLSFDISCLRLFISILAHKNVVATKTINIAITTTNLIILFEEKTIIVPPLFLNNSVKYKVVHHINFSRNHMCQETMT